MAGDDLISAHLAALDRRLPARVVDELADGLTETYQHHLGRGLAPKAAAAAAVSEFGDPDQITAAFTRQAPGRRAALALLATAPVFAASWGPALIFAKAWTWPIPTPAIAIFALTLLSAVFMLATAATSRTYRRTRLAIPGSAALITLDAAMLAAVVLAAPVLVWPMIIAVPASLARLVTTLRILPRLLPAGD
jgi:soluble lytic murein transglycosylase-like protein